MPAEFPGIPRNSPGLGESFGKGVQTFFLTIAREGPRFPSLSSMPRRLRYLPEGGCVVEVVCRVMQGRKLLRPSPECVSVVNGVLGRAQRKYDMQIHAYFTHTNHYHLLLRPRDLQQLSRFMNFVNSKLARELGRMHAWRERFWGSRYQAVIVSEEPEAQEERLLYLLRQGCKEGLISDPRDWPGASGWPALFEGRKLEGAWRDRTSECRSKTRGSSNGKEIGERWIPEEVLLTPIPAWCHLTEQERRKRLDLLLERVRAEVRELRRQGRNPSPERLLKSEDPTETVRKPPRRTLPVVHAIRRAMRLAYLEAYRKFVAEYRLAAEALKRGVLGVRFPSGSFPPPLPYQRAAPAWSSSP